MADSGNLDPSASAQTRLQEIRSKRAALAEARAKRELATDDQLVSAEAAALRNEELIDQFEQSVGPRDVRIKVVETDLGVVILKRPHRLVFKRFMDKGSTKSDDLELLVKPCLLHPDKAAFEAMLEDQPAILQRCAGACGALAGIRQEELVTK